MDYQAIISELIALEHLFEQGRLRCYSLRKALESQAHVDALAPSEGEECDSKAKVMAALTKRRNTFYNGANGKKKN